MGYRAWVCASTALLMSSTLHVPAYGQSGSAANTAMATSTTANPSGVPVLNAAAQAALQKAIASSQRIEPGRDRARNPAATLQFFGVRPTDTVIEIWPGQGWYTSILGPYLKQGSGNLIVGHFDAASTNSPVVRQIVDAYRARFASDQSTYGAVSVVPFGPRSGPLGMPGSADSVLTFRNIHNWMAQGWAEKAFGDFYFVLKPGGILGIEEHRGRTDEPQDPLARDGYVREDFVIQMAREAGFEFIGKSEINANSADTKDHPFGVWTLPPVSRTSPLGQRDDPNFDRTRYDAIGESDRMTLRFRKPLTAIGAPPAPGSRWAPVIMAPASPPVVRPPAPALRTMTSVPAVTTPPSTSTLMVPPSSARPTNMPTPNAGLPAITRRSGAAATVREAAAPRTSAPTPITAPPVIAPLVIAPPVIAPPTVPPPVIVPPSTPSPTVLTPAPSTPLQSPPPSPLVFPPAPLTATSVTPMPAQTTPVVPATEPALSPPKKALRSASEPPAPPSSQEVVPKAAPAAATRTRRGRPAARPRTVPVVVPKPQPAPDKAPDSRRGSRPSSPVAEPTGRAAPTLRAPRAGQRVRTNAPPTAPRTVTPPERTASTVTKSQSKSKASPPAATRTTAPRANSARPAPTRPAPTRASQTRPSPPPAAPKRKASPPPQSDPNKPDWVVPRRRN